MEQIPKPNLLVELAKNRAKVKKAQKGSSFFTDSSHTRFARPKSDRPAAVYGGRNGQGKP